MQDESDGGHYMYVLECVDGTLYTGYTVDVERRVAAHNAGRGAKYTRSRLPVRLVATAVFATKNEAMRAEYRFKRLSRAEKIRLLDEVWKGDYVSGFSKSIDSLCLSFRIENRMMNKGVE